MALVFKGTQPLVKESIGNEPALRQVQRWNNLLQMPPKGKGGKGKPAGPGGAGEEAKAGEKISEVEFNQTVVDKSF